MLSAIISLGSYNGVTGSYGSFTPFVAFTAEAGSDLNGRDLRSLTLLPHSPVPSELRFVVLVGWPAKGAPYSLEARLNKFDGTEFRALWTSPEFSTYSIPQAVSETSTGFFIQRFDTENPTHCRLMEDSYILTPAGAEKSGSVEVAQ